MFFRALPVIACLLTGPVSASAADADPPDVVAGLIDALGSNSYQRREAAGQKIAEVGEPALPALRAAAKNNDDAEIRYRAQRLVDLITSNACQSKSTGLRLVIIEAGEFTMGSPEAEADRRDDERQHTVRIKQTFLIGTREVTQAQYQQVIGRNPSWFSHHGEGKDKIGDKPTGRFPVESVTWFDALEFCNRLSKLDGLAPYYRLEAIERHEGKITGADVKVLGGTGYRLPTEAEWEFASRAGSGGPYHAVEGKATMRGNFQYRRAVLYGASTKIGGLGRTVEVGSYAPNLSGLHDTHGNVAEWCWDWYGKDYYSDSPEVDPRGPQTGNHRVVRGGSWLVKQSSCRCATRFWQVPSEGKYYVGFRVARDASEYLTPGQPAPDDKAN